MEWTGLNDLRSKFLKFYESKGHIILPSASLVPRDDNSLLLINSGMAPLKKYFTGIETPLLSSLAMGYGNDGEKRPEGYQKGSVFASALTGPILVKNPALLREVTRRVLAHAGAEVPETIPVDGELEKGYAVTAEQLRKRAEG